MRMLYALKTHSLSKFWIPDQSLNDYRIDIDMLNTTDIYFDKFMEEWKMIYTPFVYVNNYTDIRYHKIGGFELWCGITHFPNKEPMMMFGTTYSVKFHCEMQDTIVRFPFDKHSCNLEV